MGEVRSVVDCHVCGLFAQDEWLGMMAQVGFRAQVLPFEHSELEPGSAKLFMGIKLT